MSILAHRKSHLSDASDLINNSNQAHIAEPSATVISVTARIDYIQRFSKQTALVIDQDSNAYSYQARQYLASISQQNNKQEVNVAFVSASNKINDIQMRCRLIEQLFANALFDPEQSLAVNVLRLAKQHNDSISIVVEHAQALSLQIKYELCQLVDVAQKTNSKIDVVLFGLEQTTQDISQNRTLFDKKISIIDANTGQVLAIDNVRFKVADKLISGKAWKTITCFILASIAIIFLAWRLILEYQNFSLIELPPKPIITETLQPAVIQPVVDIQTRALASTADIQEALQLTVSNDLAQAEIKPANMSDILNALAAPAIKETAPTQAITTNAIKEVKDTPNSTEQSAVITPRAADEVSPPVKKIEQVVSEVKVPVTLNEQYYLTSAEGYVVQIAGFSELALLIKFIDGYQGLEHFAYQRRLNSKSLFVLTSKIYSTKIEANAALNALPQTIRELGAFLKPVSAIKREINIVRL